MGKVTTKDEVQLFANVLGSMETALSQVDWQVFTLRYNTKVEEMIKLHPIAKDVYTFKTTELLVAFASNVSKSMQVEEENRASDYCAAMKELDEVLKQSHVEPPAAIQLSSVLPKTGASFFVCPRCNYPWESNTGHNCTSSQSNTISLPNGVDYEQLKAWLTDSNVEVCAACLKPLKVSNENLKRKTFVGGHKNGQCPDQGYRGPTKEQINFKRTLSRQLAFQEAKPVLAVKRKKQTRVTATVTYPVASTPDLGLSSSVTFPAAVSCTPALVATATLCDSVAPDTPVTTDHPPRITAKRISAARPYINTPLQRMAWDPEVGIGVVNVPSGLQHVYESMLDVRGDGHCGFRAVALALNRAFGEKKFSYGSLRASAHLHLEQHREFFSDEKDYASGSFDGAPGARRPFVDGVLQELDYFSSPAERRYWFEGMKHGLIIADLLSVPICVTQLDSVTRSPKPSLTYFPLRECTFSTEHEPIFIHLENDHFQCGVLRKNAPMPRPVMKYKHKAFQKYVLHYQDRMEKFKEQFHLQTDKVEWWQRSRFKPIFEEIE